MTMSSSSLHIRTMISKLRQVLDIPEETLHANSGSSARYFAGPFRYHPLFTFQCH